MLSGQPAFSGASIPEVVFKVVYEQPAPLDERAPTAPTAVVTAVAQAMAKPSAERFATVAAFVEAVTGQPLTLSRGPSAAAPVAAESPSAARRVTTGEAFANTMGSGNHGDSPIGPAGASPAATARGASPPQLALPQVAPTFAVPVAERATPAPRRRSAAILAVAVAGAAAVAVGMFFAMRGVPNREPANRRDDTRAVAERATDRHPARGRDAVPAAAAEPVAAAAPPAVEQPTADHKLADERISDPAADRDASLEPRPGATEKSPALSKRGGVPRAKPAVHAPPPAVDGEPEGDADVRDQLKRAAAALDARDYDVAERVANAVINSSQAGPKQRATARLIHGTVQCAARNDQEAAQIDLRNLDGFRALRGRLLTVCRSHGILTAQ
jgi:serine/threonine-protein kinase